MAKVPTGEGVVHEASENLEDPSTAVQNGPSARDVIRSTFLSKAKMRRSKEVEFFGIQIEIRAPSYESVVKSRESQVSQNYAAISQLIECAYIPGTNEKVFEESDFDVLKEASFGKDWLAATDVLRELSDVNFPLPKSDSEETATTT